MQRVLIGLLAVLAGPADAEPVDLTDARPRWVAVRFEISPPDRPAQMRQRFTPRFPARLEPTASPHEVSVTVMGRFVEAHLMIGEEPLPGSFSDFVWILDKNTGHVRSATLSGALRRRLRWGIARWTRRAHIEVRMDTSRPVGFEARHLFGETYHRLCEAPTAERCTLVTPHRYDAATGYVNALGTITARSGGLRLVSFSPLGEAVFSEIDDPFDPIWSDLPPARSVVASPPSGE